MTDCLKSLTSTGVDRKMDGLKYSRITMEEQLMSTNSICEVYFPKDVKKKKSLPLSCSAVDLIIFLSVRMINAG